MKSFLEYINEMECNEAALAVTGNKAYPKYNKILVMAGGAGSGKGFVLNNIIAFDGKVFDVDELKTSLIKLAKLNKNSSTLNKEYKEIYGKNLTDVDLKIPKDVENLHYFVKEKKLSNMSKEIFFKAQKDSKYKQNVVFDITLKNIKDLEEVYEYAKIGGYKKEDINIVWVCTDIEVARSQNKSRSRTVPDEILFKTHKGASQTMKELISDAKLCQKYMDGDIWIVFNTKDIDSHVVFKDGAVKYIKDYNALHLKEKGKEPKSPEYFKDTVLDNKIKKYVPKGSW